MRIKESFSIGVLMALLLCSLVNITAFAQEEALGEEASSATDGIMIEEAKATWEAETVMSEEVRTTTDKVLP